jgi:hypothetical protein
LADVEPRTTHPAVTVPPNEFPPLPTIGQAVREEETGRVARNGGEADKVADQDHRRTSDEFAELDESANFATLSPLIHQAEVTFERDQMQNLSNSRFNQELYKLQTGGLEREGSEPVLPDVNEEECYTGRLRKRPQAFNADSTSLIGLARKQIGRKGQEESSLAEMQLCADTDKAERGDPERAASTQSSSSLQSTTAPTAPTRPRVRAKLTPSSHTDTTKKSPAITNIPSKARFIGRKISHIWTEADGSTKQYVGYIKCLNSDGKCLGTVLYPEALSKLSET